MSMSWGVLGGHGEKLVSWMLSLDGVEAQLYAPDWEGELPLDRARQKGGTRMDDPMQTPRFRRAEWAAHFVDPVLSCFI